MSQETNGMTLSGFENPVFDSTDIFRSVLNAMARPGEIETITPQFETPKSLNPACAALLLALADMDTQVWLAPEIDSEEARDYLKFHTGCRLVEDPDSCTFAIADTNTDLSHFKSLPLGSAEYPDRSATLIVNVSNVDNQPSIVLSGPGIQDTHELDVKDITREFWDWFNANGQLFPCGIDVVFASADKIAALPRTTRAEVA